jgi:hypothetical protein
MVNTMAAVKAALANLRLTGLRTIDVGLAISTCANSVWTLFTLICGAKRSWRRYLLLLKVGN